MYWNPLYTPPPTPGMLVALCKNSFESKAFLTHLRNFEEWKKLGNYTYEIEIEHNKVWTLNVFDGRKKKYLKICEDNNKT